MVVVAHSMQMSSQGHTATPPAYANHVGTRVPLGGDHGRGGGGGGGEYVALTNSAASSRNTTPIPHSYATGTTMPRSYPSSSHRSIISPAPSPQLMSPILSPVPKNSPRISPLLLSSKSTSGSSTRTMEEMRAHIAQLKAELEIEKAKNKQQHRDKVADLRAVRESCLRERDEAVEIAQQKLLHSNKVELQKLRDACNKEKDRELRQIQRFNEEEIRDLRVRFAQEKEDAVKVALELQKKALTEQQQVLQDGPGGALSPTFGRPTSGNSVLIVKMQKEIKSLRDENRETTEKYESVCRELDRMQNAGLSENNGNVSNSDPSKSSSVIDRNTNVNGSDKPGIISGGIRSSSKDYQDGLRDDLTDHSVRNTYDGANASHRSRNMSTSSTQTSPPSHPPLLHTEQSEEDKERQARRSLEEKEKERQLQRKVTDLNTQVTRLERRVAATRAENDTLKKQLEEHKPAEERIKKLKRRNAELASIARKLEEKAKQLQQDNLKRQRESSSSNHDTDHVKKLIARQRAKDLAEHAKQTLAKEKEIDSLRERCQQLATQLAISASEQTLVQNNEFYENSGELENIIKIAAKEKLRLERQVIHEQQQSEHDKVVSLEADNSALRDEVNRLSTQCQETEKLEVEVTQRRIECETLYKQIDEAQNKCTLLDQELEGLVQTNTQLNVQNSDLQKRVNDFEKVSEECEVLRLTVSETQRSYNKAQQEVDDLRAQVQSLQRSVQRLERDSERLHDLEKEHDLLKQRLRLKEEEINMLQQDKQNAEKQHKGSMDGLQNKLRELEQRYQLQAMKHEQLTQEMTQLKLEAEQQTTTAGGGATTTTTTNNNNNRGQRYGGGSSGAGNRSGVGKLPLIPSTDLPHGPHSMRRATGTGQGDVSDYTDDYTGTRMTSHRGAKKTAFQVFVAKYSYDPMDGSPNENPESELTISAGDYIFVYGDMDEDGFYEGELMDGTRGLVPSNFVEHVPDEDVELLQSGGAAALPARSSSALDDSSHSRAHSTEPHRTTRTHHHTHHTATTHRAPAGAGVLEPFNSSDESDRLAEIHEKRVQRANEAAKRLEDHVYDVDELMMNKSDITAADLEAQHGGGVPHPKELHVERQLSNSVMIAWTPPAITIDQIQAYHVYIDGIYKMDVASTDKTKALVEGIDHNKAHRVVVRTVTARGQSADQQCTIIVGKEVRHAVEDLRIDQITNKTAVLSWFPANSNYEHIVGVNNALVTITQPGTFKILLAGLQPGTSYSVSVRPKHSSLDSSKPQHALTVTSRFTTLYAGLPDPPLDVQVESGPKEGTLLVTWLPVTITTLGTSNGTKVTGYTVFIDGQVIKEVHNPTGDHAMLMPDDLKFVSIPHEVCVRTSGEDSRSMPSVPAKISPQIQTELNNYRIRQEHMGLSAFDHGSTISSASTTTRDAVNSGYITHHHHDPAGDLMIAQQHQIGAGGAAGAGIIRPHAYHPGVGAMSAGAMRAGLPDRMPPRGAENPPKPIHSIKVPHIGGDLYSDEDGLSSTSGLPSSKPSPLTPDHSQHFSAQHTLHSANRPFPDSPTGGPLDSNKYMGYNGASPSGAIIADKIPPGGGIGQTRPVTRRGGRRDRDIITPENRHRDRDYMDTDSDIGALDRQHNHLSGSSPAVGGVGSGRSSHLHHSLSDSHSPRHSASPAGAHHSSSHSPHHHHHPHHHSSPYSEIRDNNEIGPRKIRDDIPDSDLIDYEDDGEGESLLDGVEDMIDDIALNYDEGMVRLFVTLFDYDPLTMSPNPDGADEELPFQEGQLIKIFGDKDADGFYYGEANNKRGYVPCNMVSEVHMDDPEAAAQLYNENQQQHHQQQQQLHHHHHHNPPPHGPHHQHQASPHSNRSSPRDAPHHPGRGGHRPSPVSGRRSPVSARRRRSDRGGRLSGGSTRDSRDRSGSRDSRGSRGSPGIFPSYMVEGPTKRLVALYDYDPQKLSPNVDIEMELPFRTGEQVLVLGGMDEDGFYVGEIGGRRGLVPSNFLGEPGGAGGPPGGPSPPASMRGRGGGHGGSPRGDYHRGGGDYQRGGHHPPRGGPGDARRGPGGPQGGPQSGPGGPRRPQGDDRGGYYDDRGNPRGGGYDQQQPRDGSRDRGGGYGSLHGGPNAGGPYQQQQQQPPHGSHGPHAPPQQHGPHQQHGGPQQRGPPGNQQGPHVQPNMQQGQHPQQQQQQQGQYAQQPQQQGQYPQQTQQGMQQYPQQPGIQQQPGMQQQPGLQQQPGMQQPGMQQPGMQQPGMQQQQGMQQPGMQQGMQQQGMQQQGMQQQGMQQNYQQQQPQQQKGGGGMMNHVGGSSVGGGPHGKLSTASPAAMNSQELDAIRQRVATTSDPFLPPMQQEHHPARGKNPNVPRVHQPPPNPGAVMPVVMGNRQQQQDVPIAEKMQQVGQQVQQQVSISPSSGSIAKYTDNHITHQQQQQQVLYSDSDSSDNNLHMHHTYHTTQLEVTTSNSDNHVYHIIHNDTTALPNTIDAVHNTSDATQDTNDITQHINNEAYTSDVPLVGPPASVGVPPATAHRGILKKTERRSPVHNVSAIENVNTYAKASNDSCNNNIEDFNADHTSINSSAMGEGE